MSELPDLVCRGVQEHNLRGFDVRIPGGRLVALTGVSGSGKSSLAFDVIAREGRRRTLATLSDYARRRVGAERPPRVAAVEGLGATVALEQRDTIRSPRVTVGTLSGVSTVLRSLWAHTGEAHCPQCGKRVSEGSLEQALKPALEWGTGFRVHVLAPLWRQRRGNLEVLLAGLREDGFVRVRLDGEVRRLDEAMPASTGRYGRHDVELVVDRLRLEPARVSRFREAVERALEKTEGLFAILREDDAVRVFGTRRVCVDCALAVPELEPRSFSSNDPLGACESCQGRGTQDGLTCTDCDGTRLKAAARVVRCGGRTFPEIVLLPLAELQDWLAEIQDEPGADAVARELRTRAAERTACLVSLSLGYLALGRSSDTLSHGELQRVRLAAQIGSELQGVTYVLDEPAAGLHAVDRARLLDHLQEIRDRGNTVLLVEHDLDLIRAADWVIDLGPGAGPQGGHRVASGRPEDVALQPESRTGHALRQQRVPGARQGLGGSDQVLRILGAREHNLRGIDVSFPLGRLIAVTGVSGSGKSSLIEGTLYPALANRLQGASRTPGAHDEIEGADALDRVELVSSRALGRSPRSNPATVTRAFDEIRRLFAQLPEARTRGWTARRFSLSVTGGRCEACRGTGILRIRFEPLPASEIVCSECAGRRFRRDTLDPRFKSQSIADVLETTVQEARTLFENQPKIRRALDALDQVGLGYLTLGQPVPTLSGGEAQRLKLASEMRRRRVGKTLYLLDEPTRGLHPDDIERLMGCWRELVARGDTVILIEHHLGVIGQSDWVIDLGPGAGPEGGEVIACGTPEELARAGETPTGRALAGSLPPSPSVPVKDRRPATRLVVRGASTHNLQSLDCEIEHGAITVIRGRLGSGKTALVRGTLETEARRLFLTASAGEGVAQIEGLDCVPVRSVEGMRPVIALDDEGREKDDSRTAARIAGVDRMLRELFAREGSLHCPSCDRVARGWSPVAAVEDFLTQASREEDGLEVLAPVWWPRSERTYAIEKPDETDSLRDWCRSAGILRVRIGGDTRRLDRGPFPDRLESDTFLVIDRLGSGHDRRSRLEEAVETAHELASGVALVAPTTGELRVYSRDPGCPEHGFWPPAQLESRSFSRHDRLGACPECRGGGEHQGAPCSACGGVGLNALARSVRVLERSIADWRQLTADAMLSALQSPSSTESLVQQELAASLRRLQRLDLGRLRMSRLGDSLSSGEWARLRFAGRVPHDLVGSALVLDRTLSGLGEPDGELLWTELEGIRQRGNTVILVSNDDRWAGRADHRITLGPGGGKQGGQIVNDPVEARSPRARRRSRRSKQGWLRLKELELPNGRRLDVEIPKERLVRVIGPAGSGKSSLMRVIAGEMKGHLNGSPPGLCRERVGATSLRTVAELPHHIRRPRLGETWLDWVGLQSVVWRLYSETPRARLKGLFADPSSAGAHPEYCASCRGRGRVSVRIPLLPEAERLCPECRGRRFRAEALGVTVRGWTMGQLFDQSAGEARDVLTYDASTESRLQILESLGISSIELGRFAREVSSGERRLGALARLLAETPTGGALLVLEVPALGGTTAEVSELAGVLHGRVRRGDTVVVIDGHSAWERECDATLTITSEGVSIAGSGNDAV